MPAVRKLDQASLDQLVAGRAAGQAFRKLAEVMDADQSTLSRRVRSDPELQAAISGEKKRLARLARDRERKARAKARRAGTRPAPALEQEQSLAAGLDGGPPLAEGRALAWARVSPTRPHGRRDELRAARRVLLDQTASLEARGAALETLAGLLEATRSNGRPASSLRLEAAKALLANPTLYDPRLCGPRAEARKSPRRLGLAAWALRSRRGLSPPGSGSKAAAGASYLGRS